MKQIYNLLVSLLAICICGVQSYGFEQKQEVRFSVAKLHLRDVEISGENFTSVNYDGLFNTETVGEASLPFSLLEFEVPSNIYSFSVSAEIGGTKVIPLNSDIEVSQMPVRTDYIGKEPLSFISRCNSTVFPTANAVIVQDGYKNGDIHLVHVAVYPLIYNSELKQLIFAESIEVTLTDAKGGQFKSKAVNTYVSSLRPLKKLNASSNIKINSLDMQSMSTPTVGSGLPVYEYSVITSKKLAHAFDKIIGLKKQKGLDAGVVCIEDIKSDPAFLKGDTISNLNDDAGKLRAYLMACRQSRDGDLFVLLAGDSIPIRYAYEDSWYTRDYKIQYCPDTTVLSELHPSAFALPTDWYYTDLNGNWNKNQDDNIGDSSDLYYIDFNPDIYVGRICCKNIKEVENYTYKLLKYEMNPGDGDYSYLGNLISINADQMQNSNQSDRSWDLCKNYFNYYKNYEESPSGNSDKTVSPTASEIINEINATKYGFFNIHCHGGIFGVTVMSQFHDTWGGNTIVSMSNIKNNYRTWAREDGNSLDMLSNFNSPMIGYSMGCDLMPYDNMLLHVRERKNAKDDIFLPVGYYNFGDAFTIGGLYGGPAFIGNTRYGLIGSSFTQELQFLQQLGDNLSLGCIRARTQTLYTGSYHCRLTNNLLGCPEFKMWIKTPLNVVYNVDDTSLFAGITIVSVDDIGASCINISNGKVSKFNGIKHNDQYSVVLPLKNAVTTLTKEFCIPEIRDLTLDDVSIMANGYYFVRNIKSPQQSSPEASIHISNARVTFDANGSVDLKQKLIVDNGADVTFAITGNANFSEIEIKNGSRLTIDSNGYTLERECYCELGSELIIR